MLVGRHIANIACAYHIVIVSVSVYLLQADLTQCLFEDFNTKTLYTFTRIRGKFQSQIMKKLTVHPNVSYCEY
jgi:hypothetical protein